MPVSTDVLSSEYTFVQAAPGTVRSCIGCHENKSNAPGQRMKQNTEILSQKPAQLKPESWGTGYMDYPGMIQPIWDKHCVRCHNYQQRKGRVILTKDLGITWSLSYYMLLAKRQVADGRNGYGNQKPRTIGSSGGAL